jgi:hypothetical protein
VILPASNDKETGFACEVSAARNEQTGRPVSEPASLTAYPTTTRKGFKAELIVAFRREQTEASALNELKESDAMRTPNELKFQAKECLELADRTNDHYARTVLIELAQRLHREARQAARRERDLAFSRPRADLAIVPARTRIHQS